MAVKYLRGIGLRRVDAKGIEVRCHRCNGKISLVARRLSNGLIYCSRCGRGLR